MQRLLLLGLLACGSASTEPEPATAGAEAVTPPEPSPEVGDRRKPIAATEAPRPVEVPPPSCNVWCTPGDGPCGRWVGEHPLDWQECPIECCDMTDPVSAKPLTLEDLVHAAGRGAAPAVIRSLGRHRISPACVGIEWAPLPDQRERGTCPAGWVHLGAVRAELVVEITRAVGDGRDSTTVLHLRAETPGEGWTDAIHAALRAAWDALGEEAELRPHQQVFDVGDARVTLSADGARLAQSQPADPE